MQPTGFYSSTVTYSTMLPYSLLCLLYTFRQILHVCSLHGFSPGFVQLLSDSSWFCLASTTHLITCKSEVGRNIGFHSYFCARAVAWILIVGVASFLQLLVFVWILLVFVCLLVLCGFFTAVPGFVWLPQLESEAKQNIGFHS